MFLHTTHFACMKWKRSSIFENIQFRYLLKELNDSWFVQYLPPLPPALQKMSVIYDHIVSEWHIEDHRRQHHAHHDHCHHVGGQEEALEEVGLILSVYCCLPWECGGERGECCRFSQTSFFTLRSKKYHQCHQSHQHCFRNIVDNCLQLGILKTSWIPFALVFWLHSLAYK